MSLRDFQKVTLKKFGGAVTYLDAPTVPLGKALLAQNCEYLASEVGPRLGFGPVSGPASVARSSMFNWNSGALGNQLVSTRVTNGFLLRFDIATGAESDLINVNLGGPATYVDGGTRLYLAAFTTAHRGAGSGYVASYQSAAFVYDTLFKPPMTYVPSAPTGPAGGVVTAGAHRFGYLIEYRNGFITRPSPDSGVGNPATETFTPVSFTAAGSTNLSWTLNTAWPTGAVKAHMIMTPVSNPAKFFRVPGATQTVTGGTSHAITFTVNFTDDDLIATGTDVTDGRFLTTQTTGGSAPFNPYHVFTYGDRVGYLTAINDAAGNAVCCAFFSRKGAAQEIGLAESLVQAPGQAELRSALAIGQTIYLFGPNATYATEDTGDLPVNWPPPREIDGHRGTQCVRGAFKSLKGTTGWVIDTSGLYFFNGAYPELPISYYQQDVWDRINWAYASLIHGIDNSERKIVEVAVPLDSATTLSHVLTWDYTKGATPDKAEYSLKLFTGYSLGCMALVQNDLTGMASGVAKKQEVWVGSSTTSPVLRQKVAADANPYEDNGNAIEQIYETAVMPNQKDGEMFSAHALGLRLKGSGSIYPVLYTYDRANNQSLAVIAQASSPGRMYTLLANRKSEGFSVRLQANALGAHFVLSSLTLYVAPWVSSRGSGAVALAPSPGADVMTVFTISGTISGTNGSDGNATFTLSSTPTYLELYNNGLLQYPSVAYTLSGSTITFLAPYIPIVGDLLRATGQI